MNARDDKANMVRAVSKGEHHIRSLGGWGTVDYQVNEVPGQQPDFWAASWELRGGGSYVPFDGFEARREKWFRSKNEAVEFLQEHFDDPLALRDAVDLS